MLPRKTENDAAAAAADHHDHRGNKKKCNTVYVSSLMHPGFAINNRRRLQQQHCFLLIQCRTHIGATYIVSHQQNNSNISRSQEDTSLYLYRLCERLVFSSSSSSSSISFYDTCFYCLSSKLLDEPWKILLVAGKRLRSAFSLAIDNNCQSHNG